MEVTGRSTTPLVVAAHLLLAAALGVYADIGFHASGAWAIGPLLATPWLVLSFSAARATGAVPLAILAGAVTVGVGLITYYAWLLLGQQVAWGTVVQHFRAPLWLGAGAVVGAAFGLLGGMSLSGRRAVREVAWCTVVAVPLVDIWVRVPRTDGQILAAVALSAAAAGLFVWAVRTREVRTAQLVVGTAVMALALGLAELLVLRHLFGFNV